MEHAMVTTYYICMQYSGVTAQKCLWQVMSRPIQNYNEALVWKWHMEDLHPGKEFFITKIEGEDNGIRKTIVR